MGMGLMDLLAAAGKGGGMGMMGMMPQSGPSPFGASPVGASVVKALLAKHGEPANAPGGGTAPAVAPPTPAMAPPPDAPAPVSLAPAAPVATAPSALASLPAAPSIKKPGMFDRIGDFLKSDEGRATMMRFAAGAANGGGLGGGLTAATGFADRRHAAEAEATQHAQEMALRGRQIDDTYNLGMGRNGIDAFNANNTADHYRRSDSNQRYATDSENFRQGRDLGFKKWEHVTPSGDTAVTQEGENYRHDNASGDASLTQAGENYRHTTPSGDKVLEVREQTAPRINLHAHYSTMPEEYAANGPRLKPSEVQPGGATKIGSDQEYAALPSGARFMGPDGQIRIKP